MPDSGFPDGASATRRAFLRGTCAAGAALALPGVVRAQPGVQSRPATEPKPARTFSFLHTYEASGRYYRGLGQAGLVRPGTGIRLVNSPFGADERRFNAVAARAGELHGLLQRQGGPFIIDRIAGGAPYRDYPFDQGLIAEYARLLGPDFMGFQLHEAVCNVHNDWRRFKTADARFAREPVDASALAGYFTWNKADRWLEYGTLADYAGQRHPQDEAGFWREIARTVERQAARAGGCFTYAEGSAHGELAWPHFYRFGARSCLAEVGVWASSGTQFGIACLRGTARAYGKPWGIFFAPWGPGGCTGFVPEADWSWQCSRKELDDSGWPVGPQYGPSTALQRRIFFHAYLSGANTLHEEWGAEGNLTDWGAGTLSSYGRVTRDLLDFQQANPDVGEPYTPLAIVMDASFPPPDPAPWLALKHALFTHGPIDSKCAARPGGGRAEAECYGSCMVPEIYDLVPSDASPEVWRRYKRVLAIAPGPAPQDAVHCRPGTAASELVDACRSLSPFEQQTRLPMQINRRGTDGAWIVALYNPWGAQRGDVEGAGSTLDPGCTVGELLRVNVPVKSMRTLHAWPEGTHARLVGDEVRADVGPGGTLILELTAA